MILRVSRRGFTLIEIVLVLAIIGVIAAITLPNLVKSIRGNRLRTTSRSIVMAGRYARSMAVLQQTEMALMFNLDSGEISVRSISAEPASRSSGSSDGDEDTSALSRVSGEYERVSREEDSPVSVRQPPGQVELTRKLDRVSIEYVEITDEDEKHTEGTCSVVYRSNGTCMPYRVKIKDEQGASITIDVDALSSARTERE